MLGKMLVQGLVAAAIIGSAAAVYAQSAKDGYLPAPAAAAPAGDKAAPPADGYLRPGPDSRGFAGERREGHHEGGEHHGYKRGHDDDD